MSKPALIASFAFTFCTVIVCPSHAASMSVEILKCGEIKARDERLECFDVLADLVANSTVVSIPIEDLGVPSVTSDRQRETFGLKNKDNANVLTAQIASLTQLQRGHYRFTLDNDQVWQEIETSSRSRYAVGEAVTIERTLAGAYRVRVEATGFTNKVRRIH